MTDEQIIKAVGICRTPDTCRGCPYHELYTAGCVCALMKDVFDLINRQKAKIEREINQIKSEAIKEFAEQLKQNITESVALYWDEGTGGYYLAEDVIDDIDNLVKEMTEEKIKWTKKQLK